MGSMHVSIGGLLTTLAQKRPVFHSEADFQHAVAWQLHVQHPEMSIRLEYLAPVEGGRMYVDVWARDPSGEVLALELKYKTRRLHAVIDEEPFDLKGHGAQDQGRYDAPSNEKTPRGCVKPRQVTRLGTTRSE